MRHDTLLLQGLRSGISLSYPSTTKQLTCTMDSETWQAIQAEGTSPVPIWQHTIPRAVQHSSWYISENQNNILSHTLRPGSFLSVEQRDVMSNVKIWLWCLQLINLKEEQKWTDMNFILPPTDGFVCKYFCEWYGQSFSEEPLASITSCVQIWRTRHTNVVASKPPLN